jgi:hypothetical protein
MCLCPLIFHNKCRLFTLRNGINNFAFVSEAECVPCEVATEFLYVGRSYSSAAVCLHSVVFWDVTQRRLVSYRRFGTAYRSRLQGSKCPRIMRTIRSPETSVRKQPAVRYVSENDRIRFCVSLRLFLLQHVDGLFAWMKKYSQPSTFSLNLTFWLVMIYCAFFFI